MRTAYCAVTPRVEGEAECSFYCVTTIMITVLYNNNPCLALTYIEPVQLSNIYIFITHHGGNVILRGLQ